jgi:hypothetical protein
MQSLMKWLQQHSPAREENYVTNEERRARAAAEFMALAGLVKFLFDAMPVEQQAIVQSKLKNLIGKRMGDFPIPRDVPKGQEQVFRDRLSLIAQVILEGR